MIVRHQGEILCNDDREQWTVVREQFVVAGLGACFPRSPNARDRGHPWLEIGASFGLAVFYAGFDVCVGSGDEVIERGGVCLGSGAELYVAHVFSVAFEQASGIGQF